ncbi:CDP-alcohol phosphatidyltransferase family protein [Candidatus Bathyarchaeota archaeon]|nr:CDP-alcohol phosphatidyltransferase family protein [Candidatus Bathyarchaeota archaeon]
MNLLTKLKKTVESLLKAEAATAHRAGLTPNMISGIGVVLGLASGIIYWQAGQLITNQEKYLYYIVLAVVLLLASGYCDALDGALARLHGETTVAGGFIDSLLDRYVDAAVYCGLIVGGLCNVFWGLLALIGSLLTSYARARSEAAEIPMETIGIVERAERLIIITLTSILSVVWLEILQWVIILLAIATNLTVAQRVYYFLKKVKP